MTETAEVAIAIRSPGSASKSFPSGGENEGPWVLGREQAPLHSLMAKGGERLTSLSSSANH